jgi:flagellar motility protein MotE (MotC chaperone)
LILYKIAKTIFNYFEGTPGMNYYQEPPPGPGPAYHHEEEEERDDPADREREAFIDAKTRQLKNYFSEDEKDKVRFDSTRKDYH